MVVQILEKIDYNGRGIKACRYLSKIFYNVKKGKFKFEDGTKRLSYNNKTTEFLKLCKEKEIDVTNLILEILQNGLITKFNYHYFSNNFLMIIKLQNSSFENKNMYLKHMFDKKGCSIIVLHEDRDSSAYDYSFKRNYYHFVKTKGWIKKDSD